jgi:hypothetical protein
VDAIRGSYVLRSGIQCKNYIKTWVVPSRGPISLMYDTGEVGWGQKYCRVNTGDSASGSFVFGRAMMSGDLESRANFTRELHWWNLLG